MHFKDNAPCTSPISSLGSSFSSIETLAHDFAQYLTINKELIISTLVSYETHAVALDEFERTLDLLYNLKNNKDYFGKKTHLIKAYLPQNQPLYALTCFAIVPSLQSDKTHVRPPSVAHELFQQLVATLNLFQFFPHIEIFYNDKQTFTHTDIQKTNVVIFTGSSEVGLNMRKLFSPNTLFILNGSGHNPVIITETADLSLAVRNVLKVTLFNQGQDCSAPSSILVHRNVADRFEKLLISQLQLVEKQVGPYSNKENIVGPNTKDKHVIYIAEFFRKNKQYCIYGGNINPISQIIHPTVFCKPLDDGPMYDEYFAPVIMLQPYKDDHSLASYFSSERYKQNAMYVTVFGSTPYIEIIKADRIHSDNNIIYNSNIQEQERGFLEYGGSGPRASCVYWKSQKITGATLPQRDIFRFILNTPPTID